MLLQLVEDLARNSARHSAIPHNNRRASRIYCRGRHESFRQRHRGPREESDDHNVDWFPRRTLHEYVEDVDTASDSGEFDLRACHVGFQGHGKNRKTHRVVLPLHHSSGSHPRHRSSGQHSTG